MKKDLTKRDSRVTGRIQRGLAERSNWWDRVLDQPLAWAVVAVLGCTVILLPRAGRMLPEWGPGEVATFDVLMPVDVTVPDPAATEAIRVEARESVLPVYDFEPRQEIEVIGYIEDLFTLCRSSDSDTEIIEVDLMEGSRLLLETPMAAAIIKSECSIEFESALIDVAAQLYRTRIVDDRRALERRAADGLVLRNLSTGIERQVWPVDVAGVVDSRLDLNDAIRVRLLEQAAVPRSWLRTAVHFLQSNLPANLVFSRAETADRVRAAEEGVTPRSQVFSRGQILIRRGDRVSFAVARTLQYLSNQQRAVATYTNQIGIGALMLLVVVGLWRLLGRSSTTMEGRSRLSIIFILMVVFVGINRLGLFLATAVARSAVGPMMSDVDLYLWGIPFAAGAVTVSMLLGIELAVLFALCVSLTAAMMMGGDFSILVFALISGLVGALAAQHFRERTAFSRVGGMVGLANAVAVLALALWGGWPDSIERVAVNVLVGFLGGLFSVGVANLFLPLMESVFGITTDIRLLELSNQNLPLLKKLSLKAPGTYQHSLAVGNLAEAGADAIGANSLLLRVCSYYHDVGKLVKPEYFVENQRGANPHDSLSPSMSALVIQSHVKEGLEMAREAKLPLPIRQGIATHHGTKLIRYFYSKAKEQCDPELGEVRESDYRYPGPKPHTKELGVLLLADAVEAAARTIDSPSPGKIQGLVTRIFSDALIDGQLEDSELTFSEMEKVGSAFTWVLTNMYHHRIDYPGFDFNRRGT
ncbi:MAG: HDIG domain-containing protein [Thermoanaerobaculales bacterium]|nr:HDIG domain-containing protein [Thermoanaerobaculales bacterium]